MGVAMRARDWAPTPLGPVDGWPQSLRTSVSICLRSRFPLVVWWGSELVVLYNDAYAPILGSKHPTALGMPGRELWPEIWHIIGPMLERVLRHGEASWSEDQMLPLVRNGYTEECYFTFSYSPISDETGIGGVFTAVNETTARVIGERRLGTLRALAETSSIAKSVQQACDSAAEVLAQATADLPFSMIYLVDERGQHARLMATSGIERSHPACAAEIELTAVNQVWPLSQALREKGALIDKPNQRFGALPGGPWPESPTAALVLPIAPHGTDRAHGLLVAGVSPRRALDDAYRGFFGLVAGHVASAIGSARAYEEERRRAEALAELDRAKTTFFSNVSHEFRTPLTLMLGPLEELLAESGAAPSADQRERLQLLQRNALRLLKLVNTLLDFARLEAGRIEASYEPVDLSQATLELASVFRAAVERAGLELAVDCPELGEPIYVDRDMWEKIVLNLLSNAFKFTFEGRISVALRKLDAAAELEVRDTGGGIAPEQLPRIFERFHRVHDARARSQEGTGIGLSLVQELVRLHGGSIELESEPGRGSCFRVRIPTGSAHLPKERLGAARKLASTAIDAAVFAQEIGGWLAEPAQVEPPGVAAPADRARLLVIDDNADMREYLSRLLSSRFAVETAADGARGLTAALERPPDVILSDVMMPALDGFGLLQAIRAKPRLQRIPVMMLSARAGEEARIEGLTAGADDYLVKPFGARELIARVSTQVAVARARESLERHRTALYELFMQAPIPICVVRGLELRFEMANASYGRVSGRDNLVGQTLLEAMPELAGQGMDELLRRVMSTGKTHVGREMPVVIERDGRPQQTYWTYVYAPLENERKVADRVMAVAYDVTEQVLARNELDQARQRAEAGSRAKDEFLAMLGHELRNPLAPITTALELMRLRAPDALLKERTVVERQVLHLMRLVDDLLDVSRIARGKIELRRQPAELGEVVAQAIEMASPLLEEYGHHLSTHVPPSGLVLDCDSVRLAQVIANLLTNAAKFSEPGGRIEVRAARAADEIVLGVTDHGIGIAAELLPTIFDLFVQGQRRPTLQAGLGLGLSLVRSLVELHGGSVSAYSEGAGRGSSFVIRLPAAELSSAQPHLHPERALATLPRARRRILVVDDNRDAAELLADALGARGHETRVAFDAPGALQIAGDFAPELALLDIGLPVMDGYELGRRLREIHGCELTRLVAVTGYGHDNDRALSRDAGFDVHLVKPINLRGLEQEIERLLGERC
jgi:signal transduction histidine kinase/DNA-binding response OmpR family regulator